jgi:hypothetical protein
MATGLLLDAMLLLLDRQRSGAARALHESAGMHHAAMLYILITGREGRYIATVCYYVYAAIVSHMASHWCKRNS